MSDGEPEPTATSHDHQGDAHDQQQDRAAGGVYEPIVSPATLTPTVRIQSCRAANSPRRGAELNSHSAFQALTES
ncbi:hypothetical protein [Micromonospora sp. NPDC093244]|uniref:hypothetical protein n=1 Tax=Micromonospora sp. NPDC093244 TaxID=3155071 RepID=UPI003433D138